MGFTRPGAGPWGSTRDLPNGRELLRANDGGKGPPVPAALTPAYIAESRLRCSFFLLTSVERIKRWETPK